MKTNKRTAILLGIVAVCVVLVGGYAIADANGWFQMGQVGKDKITQGNDPVKGEIVATVNGVAITRIDVETSYQAALQKKEMEQAAGMVTEGKDDPTAIESPDDALNSLIHYEILRQEANKRGYVENTQEVEALMAGSKSYFDSLRNKGNGMSAEEKAVLAQFTQYLSGLGITEEQYWEQSRKGYQDGLLLGFVQQTILEEIITKEGLSPEEALALAEDPVEIQRKLRGFTGQLQKDGAYTVDIPQV